MIERYPQSRGALTGPVDNPRVLSARRRNFGPRPWWWGLGMAGHGREGAQAGQTSDEGRSGRAAWVGQAVRVLGGVLVGLAAASLVSGRGFGWVTALSGSGKSVQWTSPPTAVGMAIDLVGPDAVPVTRILGIVALAVVLIRLWWNAARGANWQAGGRNPLLYAGYALAATVLLAPVFHPWYALWPLAILAATLHRHLNWLVVPCAVASALCLPDGYNLALAVKTQGAVAMTVFLVWIVVHEAKNRIAGRRRADHPAGRLSGPDA
ncbi:polyprenol phosphomannose-dependent alpha 1,6 mannosyltransferase MptB [Actinoplanes sp. LDG1-01]|uniref:Polyprenol phosphomannose-dependent alpha 1,6 mannosyltransferase MptB n=2 Tax=Paractinoplanes lichenicola TaxID=2802976 RepID=A0ABS1VQJ2_9ACTN|nr:polyprenol phosphomannose-dependent alpha 1,6 mannosyltransferase MptB [Actinoplanes lichenicola]